MSIVAILILLVSSYLNIRNDTQISVPAPSTAASQSGMTSNTPLSKSGSTNAWGPSPFTQGDPIPEKKIESKKPNLEWKTRTIQLKDGRWMTYEFGKGNPVGVALSADELKAAYKRCGSKEDPDSLGELCGEESGYVSKEVEEHLLAALSDPNWDKLLSECEEQMKDTIMNHRGVNDVVNHALDTNSRDMNTFINVDQNTGRKGLAAAKIMGLRDLLRESTFVVRDMHGDTKPYKNPTCVDMYGKEIIRNLVLSLGYFGNPPEVFWPLPKEWLDPELFQL